jgi:hypothetical protein
MCSAPRLLLLVINAGRSTPTQVNSLSNEEQIDNRRLEIPRTRESHGCEPVDSVLLDSRFDAAAFGPQIVNQSFSLRVALQYKLLVSSARSQRRPVFCSSPFAN